VRELLRELDRTLVPDTLRGPQALAALAALLFAFEGVTGLLLAFHYRPTPEAAHESTMAIVRDLPFGGVIHQLHAWGALALVLIVAVRLVRLFWDGLWRSPRELLWVSAVALLWLALQFDFTGRLLPWDQSGYWSTVRGLEVVYALPLVGPVLSFLLGGQVVGEEVLTRFYVLHVMVLPVLWSLALLVTFSTLRRVGFAETRLPVPGRQQTTFRHHRYDLLFVCLLLFGVLVTLGVLAPFGVRVPADPYSTPVHAGPPWYMGAVFLVQSRVPLASWLVGGVLLAIALGVLTLPWWAGRLGERFPEQRLRLAGLVTVAVWLVLGLVAAIVGAL
jgi:quinol-cytochrome oxidoreductase complex cytochrome b subunit